MAVSIIYCVNISYYVLYYIIEKKTGFCWLLCSWDSIPDKDVITGEELTCLPMTSPVMSRSDLAAYILRCITENLHLQQIVAVGLAKWIPVTENKKNIWCPALGIVSGWTTCVHAMLDDFVPSFTTFYFIQDVFNCYLEFYNIILFKSQNTVSVVSNIK